MHLRSTLATALITAAALATPALAETQTATGGQVSATFSFDHPDDYTYENLHLTITRAGQQLFDGSPLDADCADFCWPGGGNGNDSVHVRDLDGDGEPEVVLDLYTGGAHCCVIGRFFRYTGSAYEAVGHNFADPGYRLEDLDGDGLPEIVTADARFAYAFASFAESLFPPQVFTYRAGQLADVTTQFRGLVRKDARRSLRIARRALKGTFSPRGAIAAWAADQRLLGHRRHAHRKLRRMARAGRLPARGWTPRSQKKFVSKLERLLTQYGY